MNSYRQNDSNRANRLGNAGAAARQVQRSLRLVCALARIGRALEETGRKGIATAPQLRRESKTWHQPQPKAKRSGDSSSWEATRAASAKRNWSVTLSRRFRVPSGSRGKFGKNAQG